MEELSPEEGKDLKKMLNSCTIFEVTYPKEFKTTTKIINERLKELAVDKPEETNMLDKIE